MARRKLPPDPENMNKDRADWAYQVLSRFQAITGTDHQDAIADLLADIMHLCDREPERYGRWEKELARAVRFYRDETCEAGPVLVIPAKPTRKRRT